MTNIIIEGNVIDYGYGTSDNTNPIAYSYSTAFATDGSATVKDNVFGGVSGGYAVTSIFGASTITGNTFIRNGNTVPSYISSNGNRHTIVGNVFDSPTVDGTTTGGTNESLIGTLSPECNYHSNKNQTGYASIYKANKKGTIYTNPGIVPGTGTVGYTSGTSQGTGSLENFFINFPSTETTATAIASSNIDVSNYLPLGVQLLSAVVGVFAPSGTLGDGSLCRLSFLVSNSNKYTLTNLTGTVADAANSYNLQTGTYTGADQSASSLQKFIIVGSGPGQTLASAFNSATQYVTIDFTSLANYYVTNPATEINANWEYDLSLASVSSFNIYDSPLIIRYRW